MKLDWRSNEPDDVIDAPSPAIVLEPERDDSKKHEQLNELIEKRDLLIIAERRFLADADELHRTQLRRRLET